MSEVYKSKDGSKNKARKRYGNFKTRLNKVKTNKIKTNNYKYKEVFWANDKSNRVNEKRRN